MELESGQDSNREFRASLKQRQFIKIICFAFWELGNTLSRGPLVAASAHNKRGSLIRCRFISGRLAGSAAAAAAALCNVVSLSGRLKDGYGGYLSIGIWPQLTAISREPLTLRSTHLARVHWLHGSSAQSGPEATSICLLLAHHSYGRISASGWLRASSSSKMSLIIRKLPVSSPVSRQRRV